MREQERNELRQEGWFRCAGEMQLRGIVTAETRDRFYAEAKLVFPTVDVQQGPSGEWYRLVGSGPTGEVIGWGFVRHWSRKEDALALRYDDCQGGFGVQVGDELVVAALLTRHAERTP
jgi:hypothetical protein